MNANPLPRDQKLWIYTVLPAVILNIGSLIIYGGYYSLKYMQPDTVAKIPQSSVTLTTYLLIFITEWLFALLLIFWLKRNNLSARSLILPDNRKKPFRWGPALIMGISINLLFLVYFLIARMLYGDYGASYRGLPIWGQVFQLILLPLTAAFCEELIWRGHILTQFELRGYGAWKAILLMSLSFAFIHGIFLVDKLVVTFILGIITGWYYWKERNLIPIMIAHLVLDLWGYGIFVLGFA
jgi:membrane protease YdiL (CAAX protease family)